MQNNLLLSPSKANATAESLAHDAWLILSKAEERYLFQRSHINWIQHGDCNSAYYHRLIETRRSFNYIHYLLNKQDSRVEGQIEIQKLCIDYFEDLLGSKQSAPLFDPQDLSILMTFRCSETQRTYLTKGFSRHEIRDAFFELLANKTSGPDDYTAEFFTRAWNIMGTEAMDAIQEFIKSGNLLKQ